MAVVVVATTFLVVRWWDVVAEVAARRAERAATAHGSGATAKAGSLGGRRD